MTAAPFLSTAPAFATYPGLLVSVQVAWGADLTDSDGSSWTWTDITHHAVLGGGGEEDAGGETGISITIGRADESSETQTALMVCRLDNRDGAYSDNGLSPNWPYVRRGTPVRVRVSTNAGSAWDLRFQGAANGFTPMWDPGTGRWATVELSASGPLRRIEQGTPLTSSSIYQAGMANPDVTSYWPCEDPTGSIRCVAAKNGRAGYGSIFDWDVSGEGNHTSHVGIPGQMAAYSEIPTSAPIMTIGEKAGLYCEVESVVATSQSTVRFVTSGYTQMNGEDETFAGSVDQYTGRWPTGGLLLVSTPNGGSVKAWILRYDYLNDATREPRLLLRGYSSTAPSTGDSPVFDSGTFRMTGVLGDDAEIGLTLTQSGSTTTWRFWIRELYTSNFQSVSGTRSNSGSTAPSVSRVLIGPYHDMTGLAVGHIQVLDTAITGTTQDLRDPYDGRPGETPADRIVRLAAENNTYAEALDASMPGEPSIADAMGTQYYDTLTNLLRETERTGQGVLCDGIGPGLTFVTKAYREAAANGPATLVLDAAQGHLIDPFDPIDDDQTTINNVGVTRREGVGAQHADRTGPRGIDAIGDYSSSIDVNPENEDDLVEYARWAVALGTQEGYRYPTISFALESRPELITSWLACTPQSRVDVNNIAAIRRQHPDEPIRLVLEGWIETIDAFTWRVVANTSRAEPWNVVRLAAATGSTGDGVGRMDTDGSQLNTSAAAAATSISVRTLVTPRWVTNAEDSDSFPFDITVGGCKVRVTGISGTGNPQTFTLAAPGLPRAFTGSTTAGLGAPVRLWRPPRLAL